MLASAAGSHGWCSGSAVLWLVLASAAGTETVLHQAAMLHDSRCDVAHSYVDSLDSWGATALHYAAMSGATACAEDLLIAGADSSVQDGKLGWTALQFAQDNRNYLENASKLGRRLVAKLLIATHHWRLLDQPHFAVTAPFSYDMEHDRWQRDADGWSSMHHCASDGDMSCVTFLINQDAAAQMLTWQTDAGFLPLHLAVQSGNTECARLLAASTRGTSEPDKNGNTALSTTLNGNTALHLALLHLARPDVMIKGLLPAVLKNTVAATNRHGETALHLAAWKGDSLSIEALLGHEVAGAGAAGSDLRDTSGNVPLHLAIIHGHCSGTSGVPSSVRTLLAWTARAGKTDVLVGPDAQTPLHLAAAAGHAHCCADILELGGADVQAMVSARDGLQYTPLHAAAANGRADVVELLCQYCERVDIKISQLAVGMTAFEMALAGGFAITDSFRSCLRPSCLV